MRIDLVVESELSQTSRVQQLQAMFDVPAAEKSRLEWHGELPIESHPWNVGLIVGPSGCGKTSIARQLFADHFDVPLAWQAARSLMTSLPVSASIMYRAFARRWASTRFQRGCARTGCCRTASASASNLPGDCWNCRTPSWSMNSPQSLTGSSADRIVRGP